MLLDIHGLVIECQTSSPALCAAMIRPFKFFQTSHGQAGVTVVVEQVPPPYDRFPPMNAQFSTPRNVVYHDGRMKIVDYFGRGVVCHDQRERRYEVYGTDPNLLIEVFYLLVLSLLGEHCDRTWCLRVHALALSYRDQAFLFMMPPGSGKSTLALHMMRHSTTKYISDDDPLFDRQGRILPFPRAIGILDRESLHDVPDEFISRIDRMEFGTKYFVDADRWGDRIESRALDKIVLVTVRRVLNGPTRIDPSSRRTTLAALMSESVIGIGLYQGLEFLVNRSLSELAAKVPVLARRAWLARQLARAARPYRLTMSRDAAEAGQVVRQFVESLADER